MIEAESNPVEVFTRARALLSDPNKWTHFTSARDKNNLPVHPGSSTAVAWDVEAAVGICDNSAGITPIPFLYILDRVTRELYPLKVAHAHIDTGEPEEALWDYVEFENTTYINDWYGYDAVLRILDRAIELVRDPCNL